MKNTRRRYALGKAHMRHVFGVWIATAILRGSNVHKSKVQSKEKIT